MICPQTTLFLFKDVTMQTYKMMKPSVVVTSLGLLAACSGGGGGGGGDQIPEAVPPTIDDVTSTATSALTANVLDAEAVTVTSATGQLNRSTDTGTIAGLSGTLSEDRTQIVLDDGLISFDADEDAFAARFTIETSELSALGIVGITTSTADLPTGTATYAGDTILTAQSGTDLFELTGTANITADFGANAPSVTTELTDLSGTQQPILGDEITIADGGSLTITGSSIDGAGFTGGSAELTSDVLALSGDETLNLEGGFYGPDGGEAGGVFIIDDGDTVIFGDFLAD
jgi:hypothetical protein